ncbi:MAG: tetratricopeptide repeat protein, partial [Pseudonocardia sp.]
YHASLTILEELGNRAGIATSYSQLGNIARERGDYPQAEQRYHACLTIFEELGNRAGIAAGYHQLGMIAQRRGDYAQAEQRYHASLTINEELGNRAGIASTTSQLGVLHTEQDRAIEAVPYNLTALLIRIDIDSPEARTDLYWLGEQRRALGEETFSRLLHDHLDAENAAALLVALDNPPDET